MFCKLLSCSSVPAISYMRQMLQAHYYVHKLPLLQEVQPPAVLLLLLLLWLLLLEARCPEECGTSFVLTSRARLRSSFFCFSCMRICCRFQAISLSSSSLNGHCEGMPGSLCSFGLLPLFFSSRRFFLWCSLTFLMTLYFCFSDKRFDLLFLERFGMAAAVCCCC